MHCPPNANLIRRVSGEAGADLASRISAHAAECPTCADTLASLRRTWAALDAWQPETPGVDLADRVLSAVAEAAARPQKAHVWRWPAFTRVAASVALAAGLGVGTGRLVSESRTSHREGTVADRSGDEIVHVLSSAYAATDSATGIALQFESTSTGEGGHAR